MAHNMRKQTVHVEQRPPQQKKRRVSPLFTIILSLLAIIVLAHFIAVTHSAYPTASTGTCSDLIRNTDYTKFVSLQTKTQEMGAVQFTDDLTGGQASALIQVTDNSMQHLLDIYVYGCTLQQGTPTLSLFFKQQGLIQGTVVITQDHTLSVGRLDTTISPANADLLQPSQQYVYQEYTWSNGVLVETLFPGLYPVTSRNEAEDLQQQADNALQLPWIDPQATAQQLAVDIFHWPVADTGAKTLDNDQVSAHVLLILTHPRLEVTVTLSRLIQHDKNGLWFVTGAQTRNITLDQPVLATPVASPMLVRGSIAQPLAHNQVVATLFDHTLTPLSLLNGSALTVQKAGYYSGNLFYSNPVPNQPCLLLVEDLPSAGSKEQGYLLLSNAILG